MVFPQGYHITFGTYLARPPGSGKPHVDNDHNRYKAPLAPTDPEREERSRAIAIDAPVRLTFEQRDAVERAITDLAKRYRWPLHAIAIQSDHAHQVLSAPRPGPELRDALKAAASRALSARWGRRTWWAEGGSVKYLWKRSYFLNAIEYVRGQRDF